MTDLTAWIEHGSGWGGLHLSEVLVLIARVHVSLIARSGRNYREPDDPLRSPLLLQPLHIAAVVVFLHVRASVVVPLKHDEFPMIVRKMNGLSGAGRAGKI